MLLDAYAAALVNSRTAERADRRRHRAPLGIPGGVAAPAEK